MDSAEFEQEITRCAHTQKRTLVENYVQSQLAIDYDYFLRHGREQFPEHDFEEVTAAIRAIDLGCQVILAGFLSKKPFLFTIEANGTVFREESFAVIGSGAPGAQASLFRRGYRGYMGPLEAAYYIYEAKKFSEIAPGVGPNTDMAMAAPSLRQGFARWKHVSALYLQRLEEDYKKFGPQRYQPSNWPELLPGLEFPEEQSDPESTTHDQTPQPPSLASPVASGES
jgi:hypothetical protein